MSAKPLTKVEKSWLKKLEKVMNECPSDRLACYTTGDRDLTFYDQFVANKWEDENPMEELDATDLHIRAGSRLDSICGSFIIDSCAG